MNSSMSGIDYSFRELMESISIPAYMFDREGQIVWYNTAAVQLWGRHPDPERDRWCGFRAMYWPDGTPVLQEDLPPRQIIQGHSSCQGIEIMADRMDGSRVNVMPHLMALRDGSGETVGGVSIQLDITTCRTMEAALSRREAEFRTLVENSSDEIVRYDLAGRRVYVNTPFVRTVGKDPETLIGKTILDDWCGPSADHLYRKLMQVRDLQKSDGFEMVWDAGDDDRKLYRYVRIVPEFNKAGQLESLVVISRDISAIKQTELQLRNLAARRDAIVEAERKRIAQEIHDELGQLLNTLHISNATMRAMLPQESPALQEKSDALAGLIRRCIDVARNVATCLRPAALEAGIVCGLEWLVREFGEHTGIECVLVREPADLEPDLKEDQAMALFRIAQESMTNVVRHSGARMLSVRLSGTPEEIRLEVRDDGNGFDVTTMNRRSSLGLVGMRERAIAMGGHLDVSSSPGQGTLVRVALALRNMREVLND